MFVLCVIARVNGKLVALKVIRLQEEEGTPFTAIREGKRFRNAETVTLFKYTGKQINRLEGNSD